MDTYLITLSDGSDYKLTASSSHEATNEAVKKANLGLVWVMQVKKEKGK